MPKPFAPDSRLVKEIRSSPNYGARRGVIRPDLLILHYTGMPDCESALRRLTEKSSEVSSHYLVFENGRIVQLVPENKRAWHAGVSAWQAESDINSRAIGIEICNPGHDFGYPNFSRKQMKAVIALCKNIVRRNGIRPEHVLAHSDIAPTRKQDPGEKFPWAQLHKAGIGHFVRPAKISSSKKFRRGDRSAKILEVQRQFAEYGYRIIVNGKFDAATEAVVTAFQRHFRPQRVDGVLDVSTRKTLHKLLSKRPSRRG